MGYRIGEGCDVEETLSEIQTHIAEIKQQVSEIHTFMMEFAKQMEAIGNNPMLKTLMGGAIPKLGKKKT